MPGGVAAEADTEDEVGGYGVSGGRGEDVGGEIG